MLWLVYDTCHFLRGGYDKFGLELVCKSHNKFEQDFLNRSMYLATRHLSQNSFFTLCTVLIPFFVSLATSRMAYPLFRRLMTSLYSSLFLSWDMVEPAGLPSLPPFSIYCFFQDLGSKDYVITSLHHPN